MTNPNPPMYLCDMGEATDGTVTGMTCQAENGAPTAAGYHSGTFLIGWSGEAGSSGAVYQCASGVTISYSPMVVTAEGNITMLE